MAKEHRYILQPGSKKHLCPDCGKKNFVLYLDTTTGEPLPEQYGRCDREINCAYHLNPYSDGYAKMISQQEQGQHSGNWQPARTAPWPKPTPKPKPSFIPVAIFKQSRAAYQQNNLVQWLTGRFDSEIASELVSRYHIGTSKYQFSRTDFPGYKSEKGAAIFWQIDVSGKVRTGKIMLYSPITGKRIKEPFHHITWVHKALKLPAFELQQCYFGEHLLKVEPSKPVALVESEKTALIASVYLPQFIWLAVGSLSNLNAAKCQVLTSRNVCLFPDLNGFEKWSAKAKELAGIANFTVSDLLERKATEPEKVQGLDLADYLIRFDYRCFEVAGYSDKKVKVPVNEPVKTITFPSNPEPLKVKNLTKPYFSDLLKKEPLPAWNIAELEAFFTGLPLTGQPVQLNPCSTITDVPLFIQSHLATVNANNGKHAFLPYLQRLQQLKQVLTLPAT